MLQFYAEQMCVLQMHIIPEKVHYNKEKNEKQTKIESVSTVTKGLYSSLR